MRSLKLYIVLCCITIVAGCNPTGPRSLRMGRASYNIAIQQTNNEQLLLNLVRLRYRDTPYFLEVATVSTAFDLTAAASAIASLPESADRTYDLGAGISYSEQPTVTYTPLQGDEFVTQLMSPVDLNTILLLYHSGWSVERIFRVCVQSLNGLKNAPSASGPTPDRVPIYKQFCEVAKLLRDLQIKGVLEMGQNVQQGDEKPAIELEIAKRASDWDEVRRLCELLGLEFGRTNFRLTTEVGTGGKDRIAVAARSLMASLFYLSQSVLVPPEDEHAGRVTVSRDEQGNRFDWRQVTGGLMEIRSATKRPANAYVLVLYRGAWFYIDDSDLTSKSTFSLLTQLSSLQAGEIKSPGPILTLPVTR